MAKTNASHMRGMEIRSFILSNVRSHPRDIVSITVDHFNISRQAVLRHVRILEDDKFLQIQGTTKNRKYEPLPALDDWLEFPVDGTLAEDKVWRESVLPLIKDKINPNVREICEYGLTEMVNNVIDHSESLKLIVGVIVYIDVCLDRRYTH